MYSTTIILAVITVLNFLTLGVKSLPIISTLSTRSDSSSSHTCFPALSFNTTSLTGNNTHPSTSLSDWWCDPVDEQGFFGFSYRTSACQSPAQLTADFTRMRTEFKARYVRLYFWCDKDGFLDDVVKAAYEAGIGVYAVIWFGFDGGNAWEGRRDQVIDLVTKNPLAPYVIRSIDVGSEPLFDSVLPPDQLNDQITNVRKQVKGTGVNVTISDMKYSYTKKGADATFIFKNEDMVHAHELPYFDSNATTGDKAWPSIESSIKWFVQETGGKKKITIVETGWPSNNHNWPQTTGVIPSVANEEAYMNLLNSKCSELKSLTPLGGVGWFWNIWSDKMLGGWGFLDSQGNPKFDFKPIVSC